MFCTAGLVFGGNEGVGSFFNVLHALTHFRWYQGRRVPILCFARRDSFSAVSRVSGPVFKFCAPGHFFRRYRGRRVPFSFFVRPDSLSAVPRASGPVFMFSAPGLVFKFCAHGLVFSVVPRASGPVFMLCAPRLVFGGNRAIGSCFHVFSARTCFRRYRGR
jgi:hypothetical protein